MPFRMAVSFESRIEEAAAALKAAGAREVYVFGSAATGKMRENSDVDMAVSNLPAGVFFEPWPPLTTRSVARSI
ncbi:MAG TPA: nucleotidyltransferase domain-containing protein [Terriglobia bacterium]|nr:nucleotidyltransferase domain-containing protein [Terriglobia bacterium]